MTVKDAHAIQVNLAELEFPRVFSASVFFALFKAYGIPSISNLLVATGQLADDEKASKRAADTGILLVEAVIGNPKDPRTIDAIARINYLHSRYIKAGKISNDDMLYTLSLFALEPARWTDRWEWRKLTDMEKCAIGVFWKNLGDAMEIKYDPLSSFDLGWSDGLGWLAELSEWSLRYEEQSMIPVEANKILADSAIGIIMFNTPGFMRLFLKRTVSVLVGERLCKAMMLEPADAIFTSFIVGVGRARKFITRYLMLPRPSFMRESRYPKLANKLTGRYNTVKWTAHPWYAGKTFRNRWGDVGFATRFLGGAVPGDDNDKYHSQGYRINEIGPMPLESRFATKLSSTLATLHYVRLLHTATPGSDRTLILYAYKETPNARKNALFFINHGLHSAADFIFILNGETNLTLSIPTNQPNIRVIERGDTCFDMGAYGEVLNANDQALVKQHNKFILINASIRGPFMPTWSRECWTDAYLARITDTNKLVGITYNCKPARKEVHPHIQSMILATDSEGMRLLLPVLSGCPTSHMKAIYAEGNSTRAIWGGGYTVTAFMTAFASKEDYVKVCQHGDVLGAHSYYGMAVHPYETIFAKANRHYGQRELDLYSDWADQAGYSSYEVCGKTRDTLSPLGGWGRWKQAAARAIG
ncbi:hypothetical protein H072_5474 [Dactylellina haptotyla CBS 200.50]|uniref:ER-bound oxygenase mpaB/mpaB'/Rubber oxygenase catalytic domain-containing protein n=1 Tax=Dactylellina haptotyla (strain CBS 200.50) TaxID=1284197 RepID=S8AHP3_DACHA|nr:hypothetical protein H072_5474 [Dactylellina haptotyla CBS 200.50]